jgi:hypothetical protein
MAVSIVSKQYGDDNTSPIVDPSTQDEALSPIGGEENNTTITSDDSNIFSAETNISEVANTAQEATITQEENNDNGWLNDLHPEQTVALESPEEDKSTTAESSEPIIPNMYIQAEQATMEVPSDVAIFSEEKKEDASGGFDMDDLLGDEMQTQISDEQVPASPQEGNIVQTNSAQIEANDQNNTIQESIAQDPFVQKKEEVVQQKISPSQTTQQTKTLPNTAPKKSLTKSLAMVAAGLFGVVVIGFVVMTMFPAGMDTSAPQIPYDNTIVDINPIEEEPVVEHAADDRTPQQIAREELVSYSILGEEYYELGRDLKDRNMVRYALYVEKKSKDLIEMLDLDPDMDTREVVVYFAQFDDYLKTLEDWKATLGDTLPVP